MDDKHACTQERVLATMCEQLKNIESDIHEIKETQRSFMESTNVLMLDIAKRPSPENMAIAMSKLDKHETYFKIIWMALGGAWSVLLVILGIWIKGWF